MVQEETPCDVQELLEQQGLNGEQVLLSTSSDLGLRGEPRRQWLVVTRSNVSVVADGAAPEVVQHVPLNRIEKFRSHSAIGSGFLQAYVNGAWIDVLRHSNSLAWRFHQVAGRLEGLRTTGEVAATHDADTDQLRCTTCDRRLSAKGEPCPRCLPRKAIAARLWQIMRPQWPTALAMSALMVVGVAMELAPPKLQQYLVDDILAGGQLNPDARTLLSALLLVVLALAGTRVLLGVVNWGKGLLATRVGVRLTFDLRSELMHKLHALGVGFYDRHQVGSLVSRVAYDSEVLHTLLQQVTGGFLLQIVQIVAVGAMLFTLNPKLALYTLIPAPLVVAGSLYFWKRVYPVYYRYWESSSKQAGAVSAMLSGIRVVKAFAQEPRELVRFQRASEYLRDSRLTVEGANASFSAAMALIFSLGGLIVWYVGGRDVLAGSMTLGSLMAFLAYLAMFYAPLSTLSQLTTWLTNFLTGCQRVFELLDTPEETKQPDEETQLPVVRGEIRFDGVTFGYERHRPILKDVSFAIEPGQRIGIVGRSGSGKTTLVNLLSRFYDVDQGRVLLDGVDLRELSTQSLRQNVGVVLQEPFLFRGTIFDNLIYGRPGSTREETLIAARAAQAHDFILNKPQGYDTWIGERGAGLSGGERQRVSIARALLYDPKVLILDEATSSVDTESEQAIQDALRVLARGRTTLAIAHRLSTLRDSDRIFVFDDGRLIEQGTHSELMELDGTYARLVKIQTRIARDNQVEALLMPQATAEPVASDPAPVAEFVPQWLEPANTTLRSGPHDSLAVELSDGIIHCGVSASRCFPASDPDGFISLRACDHDGKERELGMLRALSDWPVETQALVRAELDKRCLERRITAIDRVKLQHGCLDFDIQTEQGPGCFTMRWTQSQVQDFGQRGKVLIDLDENRYLIPDIDALPPRQRERLQRYIYW